MAPRTSKATSEATKESPAKPAPTAKGAKAAAEPKALKTPQKATPSKVSKTAVKAAATPAIEKPTELAKPSKASAKSAKAPKAPQAQAKEPEVAAGVNAEAVAEPARRKAKTEPEAKSAPEKAAGKLAGTTTDQDASLPILASSILAAIREGRAVEFIFADGDTNPPRTFEPRQLIFDVFAQGWFVWGWDRRYNAERHHRVDLLSEVNAVEGVGRSAQGPYKEGTPANQIGGWLGGEAISVKATLLKQWVFAVKQAPAPFPEFRIEDAEEGKATVTFTGTDLRAISRWCMQFGDGIQVVEPQRLVDRIKQVGANWAGKPKGPEPVQAKPAPSRPERSEGRSDRSEGRSDRNESRERGEGRHERGDARQDRQESRDREARSETRPERRESRPEGRHDHDRKPRNEAPAHRESREPREFQRESRESEAPKPKSGRIEIRFDRL